MDEINKHCTRKSATKILAVVVSLLASILPHSKALLAEGREFLTCEDAVCAIHDLTCKVHEDLGNYDAYTQCGKYSNRFTHRCEEQGLVCETYSMYCNGLAHAVVVVTIGDGECIIANPTSTGNSVYGDPFPCSDLDDGIKDMPPEGCGPTGSPQSENPCTCTFTKPDDGVIHEHLDPWEVANKVFRELPWYTKHLAAVGGMNQLALCNHVCDEVTKTNLASAKTAEEKKAAEAWRKDCYQSCRNYFEEAGW